MVAWASENCEEIAEQLGKMVEIKKYSQQNVVPDHHSHPVQRVWLLLSVVKELFGATLVPRSF